jgi:hypothetical protein
MPCLDGWPKGTGVGRAWGGRGAGVGRAWGGRGAGVGRAWGGRWAGVGRRSAAYRNGFQRAIMALSSSTSLGFISGSGGRTAPPTRPTASMATFMAVTS